MYRMQQQEASTTEPMNMVSSKPLPVEEHSLTYNVENDDAHIDEEQRPYFSESRRQQENHWRMGSLTLFFGGPGSHVE